MLVYKLKILFKIEHVIGRLNHCLLFVLVLTVSMVYRYRLIYITPYQAQANQFIAANYCFYFL